MMPPCIFAPRLLVTGYGIGDPSRLVRVYLLTLMPN